MAEKQNGIHIYSFVVKTFRLLREHQPWKLVVIFLLTLLLGATSGFSIVLLIPLLQLLNVGTDGPTDQLAQFFQNMAAKSGISLTFESVLFVYVILLTLSAFIQYYKSVLDARYQQTFIYKLRRRLFRKIIMAEWSSLNSKSKTNHLQVLTKEVPNLADYYYFYLRLLTTLLMTTTYVAYAMVVSVKFTLVTIFIGIILFFFLRKFLFKAFHLGEGIVRSYNQLLKYIDDFWQTVKIAKVHNSEEFYYRKFDEASNSLLDLEFRMQRNYSIPHLIFRISGILVLVLIVYLGYRIDQLPLTSFFTLILLFSRIYPQFIGINTDVNMIVSNVASVKLVLKLDEDFPDPDFHRLYLLPGMSLDQKITLENIRFGYADGEMLLDNYTESIPAKKITGILGESGRGKTTLIDLIAGLQTPDQGEIRVDGQLLDESLLPSWKSSIGYLPQDAFFIDGTFRENLVWDSRETINDKDIIDVLEQVNAAHLVTRFEKGLDEVVVNYAYNLSGGERQRLALARVLLRKPQLLLLDEATSSLDADNEQTIMEVLSRLKERVTIVFVTHRVSLLPWFDKVIKLK